MNLEETENGVGDEDSGFQFGGDTVHVVEFYLGEDACAIDIDTVDGIVEMKQVTRVPRAPDAVEGVIDLRGETTAVVDPTRFLDVDDSGVEQNILVLDREDDTQQIGIRVDGVTEVRTYDDAQVDYNAELSDIQSGALQDDLVRGVIRKPVGEVDEDGDPEDVELVLWLDIDRMISRAAGADETGTDPGPQGDTHA